MKGLIIKDLENLKKQSRVLLILVVFVAIAIINPDIQDTFLTSIFSMLSLIIMITLFSMDELANWNKFALTTGINRSDLVTSKYFLALIFLLFSLVLSLATNFIMGKVNFHDSFIMSGITVSSFIIILSVIFPIFFKFGVQKGRIIMMIPIVLFYGISKMNLIIGNLESLFAYLPIVAIATYAASIYLSIKITNGKEFQ